MIWLIAINPNVKFVLYADDTYLYLYPALPLKKASLWQMMC